jgi:hypothetical protein
MYDPRFVLRSFDTLGPDDKLKILRSLLDSLILVDSLYLLSAPSTPLLYEAGLHYEPEELGRDDWRDVPSVLDHKGGDCEDLACWRVAELRLRFGVIAEPYVTGKLVNSPKWGPFTLYHIRVLFPDGHIEDPSKNLGMPG